MTNAVTRRARPDFTPPTRHWLPHWTFFLPVAVLCLGSTAVASAQDQDLIWTGIGPDTAYVRALAISATDPVAPTLYAGLVKDYDHPVWGVYKKVDGADW